MPIRGTRIKVNRLQVGDRFYRPSDKSKQVWEMVSGERKVTAFRTYGYWCKRDNDASPVAITGKTEVIYLRHNENSTVTGLSSTPFNKHFQAENFKMKNAHSVGGR